MSTVKISIQKSNPQITQIPKEPKINKVCKATSIIFMSLGALLIVINQPVGVLFLATGLILYTSTLCCCNGNSSVKNNTTWKGGYYPPSNTTRHYFWGYPRPRRETTYWFNRSYKKPASPNVPRGPKVQVGGGHNQKTKQPPSFHKKTPFEQAGHTPNTPPTGAKVKVGGGNNQVPRQTAFKARKSSSSNTSQTNTFTSRSNPTSRTRNGGYKGMPTSAQPRNKKVQVGTRRK